MIWSYSWILHCVGTLYGQMAGMYLLNCTCVCMMHVSVCFFSFLLLIQQFTGPRQLPSYFRLIQAFSYCIHEFLREQELETDRMPVTDMTDSFYDNVSAPDRRDVRELWAIRPRVNWVEVICVWELHIFFHQYVANLRDKKSENVVLLMSALTDSQPEVDNYVLQSACRTGKPENIRITVLYLTTCVRYYCYEFFWGDGVRVGCSGGTNPASDRRGQWYRCWHYGHSVRCSSASRY